MMLCLFPLDFLFLAVAGHRAIHPVIVTATVGSGLGWTLCLLESWTMVFPSFTPLMATLV